MSIVLFELAGELALWRNVYESIGSFSALGPAPSALAGICGAALGFPSPHSAAMENPDEKTLKTQSKNGLVWPVSPQLLAWERDNDVQVACRWLGGYPRRISWNINGFKEVKAFETLRMQQQMIENPRYEAAVRLPSPAAKELMAALQRPAFRLFLGCSCCPAIVKQVREAETIPESNTWAFRTEHGAIGEATPFSQHVVPASPTSKVQHSDDKDTSSSECYDRVKISGYWIYPTPNFPGMAQNDPFVRTCCQ